MYGTENERPSIEERYGSAVATSSMRVHRTDEDTQGSADLIIAAGAVTHVETDKKGDAALGLSLLRLHTEWTAAAKPQRLTTAELTKLAHDHRDQQGKPNHGKAKTEAARWYSNELRLLVLNLRSRPHVLPALTAWAKGKGIPERAVASAVLHWLSPVCGHCGGHGLLKVDGAPALGGMKCDNCSAGVKRYSNDDRKVLDHIGQCVSDAMTAISRRLRR